MITPFEIIHAGTKFLDDAGGLMAERDRQRARAVTVDAGQILTSTSPGPGGARSTISIDKGRDVA
jgi:hypothetical protein